MKYIKTYERVWSKNLKEGNIYLINELLIADRGYRHNYHLGKIINITTDNGQLSIIIKTYIKGTTEEYINEFSKKWIKRLATPEEIEEFETIENSKKYNL